MNIFKKLVIIVVLAAMMLPLFTGCGSNNEKRYNTIEDFEHARVGVMTGSSFDTLAKEYLPEAERVYFMIATDLILNLEQGKIDGILMDKGYYTPMVWEDEGLSYIEADMPNTEYAIAFPKSSDSDVLAEQVNEFIKDQGESGWLKELEDKWISDEEPDFIPDTDSLTGENGTIKVATTSQFKPYDYLKDGKLTGMEIEFIVRFAEEYGYDLELDPMDFSAILPSIAAGRYDMAISNITVTEERAESVRFSDPYYKSPIIMAVLSDSTGGQQLGFGERIVEGFSKTFIREDRWKHIVDGIGVTMLISLCAVLLGTLLGFGIYMVTCMNVKGVRVVSEAIAKVYTRIIEGTPVVVVLMILFYVVFGSVKDINGVVVAILGFSLIFGAFVYEHMRVSVGSVDIGQAEAAYALGYTKNKAYTRIILPQAMSIFMPTYCSHAVELIKGTAIVGYIAVNDLTKVGDIIRSNTYEAFFPLVSVAIIYFLLTWIISLLLRRVKVRFEPKRRSNDTILKGVKR